MQISEDFSCQFKFLLYLCSRNKSQLLVISAFKSLYGVALERVVSNCALKRRAKHRKVLFFSQKNRVLRTRRKIMAMPYRYAINHKITLLYLMRSSGVSKFMLRIKNIRMAYSIILLLGTPLRLITSSMHSLPSCSLRNCSESFFLLAIILFLQKILPICHKSKFAIFLYFW